MNALDPQPASQPAAGPAQALSPAGWRPHRLHALDRDWPETNCDLDLWIELAQARGGEAEAILGFTASQDFQSDQFDLLVPPKEELERFFGAVVRPLALYEKFEDHFVRRISDGGFVLLETDACYLPDAAGVAYRRRHVKSTIAIAAIRPAERTLDYFHNLGFWRLEGDDYDMVVHRPPHLQGDEIIPPYAEAIVFDREPLRGRALRAAARERLALRLSRAPRRDPVAAFGASLAPRIAALAGKGAHAFHDWAFHTLRQLGANFELLADHLAWLEADAFEPAVIACKQVSAGAKTLQFQLARAVARGRTPNADAIVADLSRARLTALAGVDASLRRLR
ncbi:MAG: DUF1839 family protein [Hyphomicrobiales bacterium]|nr:DUF1839 family protein [Hyphomicrobiales bacterium]